MILFEGKASFVMMNRYPYTCGHLMVIPVRHVSLLEELSDEENKEILRLTGFTTKILREVMRCEGFNIGLNLGKAAGAGIDDHLHVHVVPRWSGDTNFISVIGEVRVIPEDLTATRDRLLPYFKGLGELI